jgi:DNA replication protein DnaC
LEKKCDKCGKNMLETDKFKIENKYGMEYFYCNPCVEIISEEKNNKMKEYREFEIKNKIPSKYWDINTSRQEIIKNSFSKSMFITGGVGTGKTVFASSLAKKYILNGNGVEWVSYPALIMEIQNKFSKKLLSDEETAFDLAEKYAKTDDILFLDDLGAEKLTEFVRQITYFILNEREQNQLITVITSNFSIKQLDEQIDERVSSRIAGMCEVLKFTGVDMRIKKPE